ncbi:hypothetical protein G7046_g9390 [Stylonectria norvegica]|nr:hypothetical protein G7046_g9390 [Stylonectria norvegica]
MTAASRSTMHISFPYNRANAVDKYTLLVDRAFEIMDSSPQEGDICRNLDDDVTEEERDIFVADETLQAADDANIAAPSTRLPNVPRVDSSTPATNYTGPPTAQARDHLYH